MVRRFTTRFGSKSLSEASFYSLKLLFPMNGRAIKQVIKLGRSKGLSIDDELSDNKNVRLYVFSRD